MPSESIVNVTEAQARLSKLIDKDMFAISRHGKIVGVYLSRDRIEALVESMELLSNPEFAKALKEYESGRTKFHETRELDKAMSK
jgi:PHD/YefM family antitoxin component YafN of YafNO toxin-antitoxin module